VPDLKTGARMLLAGEVSAYATNKAILAEMARAVPGSRMLEGRWGMESLAVGIPKGREAGMAWLRGFVDEARTDGAITRALERAGLRGIAQPAP
jgi:polar amino acid transport system substrate-binding protein